ncbi:WhiB family transcriptional regulator [Arcanobacterium haemolyticum]|nr:WhiB family transcriptional regulator [Arcanobacterium haemolyticum]
MADQTWAALGACTATDPDTLFVKGAAQRQVRQVCFNCPVRLNCLIDALDSKATYGVWGGLTERERRVLLRRMPVNTDWYNWLTSSEDPIAVDIRQGRIPRLGDH